MEIVFNPKSNRFYLAIQDHIFDFTSLADAKQLFSELQRAIHKCKIRREL